MGTGIGIVANRHAGLDVVFVDPKQKQLTDCELFTQVWCDKEMKKGRMDDKLKAEVLGRMSYMDSLASLHDCDFVVEAASEDFNIKKAIFNSVLENAPSHAILASNTSSISISKIAGTIP